jgi:hypothetical protein
VNRRDRRVPVPIRHERRRDRLARFTHLIAHIMRHHAHPREGTFMTVEQLIEHLQGETGTDVLIHDPATGNDLPIGRVDMKYGQPIVLHAKDDSGGES